MKLPRLFPILFSLVTPLAAQQPPERNSELQSPFRVLCGEQPIDVDFGHAAPFLADMDGDGLKDLLVGEFGKVKGRKCWGALRIYRNVGGKDQPRFESFEYFQAGGTTGQIPSG